MIMSGTTSAHDPPGGADVAGQLREEADAAADVEAPLAGARDDGADPRALLGDVGRGARAGPGGPG
jgi:hypothetical protein